MDFREYEKFVAELYRAVATTERWTTNLKTTTFERNTKITNRYGVDREFDVYWEYELDGIVHRAVIECKYHTDRIPIGAIDSLIGKLKDIEGEVTPIFATKTGYQSGAKKAADYHEIELLIAREQNLSDWTAEDGKAVVRRIIVTITMDAQASIHNFAPEVDLDWVRNHTTIDTTEPLHFNGLNNEIFVDDKANQDRFSLMELSMRLGREKSPGVFQEKREFTNAYIEVPNIGRLKLISFSLDYSVPHPCRKTIEIDYGKALVGVLEYLQKGEKKLIFKNKVK